MKEINRAVALLMTAFAFLAGKPANCAEVEDAIRGTDLIVSPEGEARILLDIRMPADLDLERTALGDAVLRIPAATILGEDNLELGAYIVTTPWSPGGADWTGGWERAGGDYEEGNSSRGTIPTRAATAEVAIDVSRIVRAALDGDEYYGMILMVPPGTAAPLDAERGEAIRSACDQATFEIRTRPIPPGPPPRGWNDEE